MKIRKFVLKAEKVIDRLLGVYNNRLPATNYVPLKELGERYGLEIVTDARAENEETEFDCPSSVQVRIYAPLLASELAVYPPEFIKESNVERLVLCTNLRSLHHKVSGLADMGPLKIDTLFLDRRTPKETGTSADEHSTTSFTTLSILVTRWKVTLIRIGAN